MLHLLRLDNIPQCLDGVLERSSGDYRVVSHLSTVSTVTVFRDLMVQRLYQ